MNGTVDEDDSDIEIIEPAVLRAQFRTQQLRLIQGLKQCNCSIPKKWEHFQKFVKNILKLHLSDDLIKSVWLELIAVEQINGTTHETVEISDEEDVTEQNKTLFSAQKSEPLEIVDAEAYPCWRIQENTTVTVEISDDEIDSKEWANKQPETHSVKVSSPLKSIEVSEKSNEQSFSMQNEQKRKQHNSSMTEEEAEALREQLVMDKLIEFELSKLLTTYFQNKVVTKKVRKKRKSSIKKSEVSTELKEKKKVPPSW